MDAFNSVNGDKILFLGEGNFSFCVDFIKLYILKENVSDFEVIATCFESDNNLSDITKSNIQFLRKKGVTILFDVDTNRLKEHPTIGCKVFTKIVFNFPHVGGKMKIHLNRELLSKFFLSSKSVLDEDGIILLTLCDGQGGTDADKNKRRWDDTWKVVELAAEAEFALISVQNFNREHFPGYINVGYRSLDKGFNTQNALTHVFKGSKCDVITNLNRCDIKSLFNREKTLWQENEVSKVYLKSIIQDPFNNACSPQSVLYEHFRKVVFDKEIKFCDDVMLLYGYSSSNTNSCDALKEHIDLNISYDKYICVYKGMCLHKFTNDFSHQPVSCEIIYVGNDCTKLVSKILKEVFAQFTSCDNDIVEYECVNDGHELICIENWDKLIVAENESVVLDNNIVNICTIFLDNFALGILHLSCWQELWAENSKIVQNATEIKLLTPCIFPHTFTFDLSFSVKKGFVEDDFIKLLWHTVGNIVVDAFLISRYTPPNKIDYNNFCYRIKYRSYEVPLFKKRVIEIQRILGQILGKCFNVTIL